MRTIDLTTWPRRAHFEFFLHHTQPHFSVTAPLDVTTFRTAVRDRGLSVMTATSYVLARAANELAPLPLAHPERRGRRARAGPPVRHRQRARQ
ncbi:MULTISPECIES: CatA-like O-acetyltransferase [Deinococcus]|uniref:CatA-like O-acetyltransferase n=1 Tax=Deinococcus TaxID=1298 RepID=UPI001665E8A7|nr:hypothetical protein GCM10008019_22920 [Deinococcus soli (ex Cha et al. 2016)]